MALIDKASLLMVPSTYEAGTLYNVLPSGNRAPDKTGENSGYDQTRADFTFDRGTNAAATRVNSDGLIEKYRENLLVQSNQFDTTWLKNQSSITSSQEGYDGTNNAWKLVENSVNTFHSVYQTNLNTGVSALSVYAKTSGRDLQLRVNGIGLGRAFVNYDLSAGTIGSSGGSSLIDSSIESVGNGWYRCSFSLSDSGTYGVDILTITDASTSAELQTYIGDNTSGVFIQNAQLETSLVATDYLDSGATTAKAGVLIDLPRINYDANGENGSLLLEPSRQQLLQYSEYFNGWTKVDTTLTNNYGISPEGVKNSTRVQFADSTAYMYIAPGGTSSGTYASSIYIKGTDGETIKFGKGGNVASGAMHTLNGDWQRIEHITTDVGLSVHISTYGGSTARDIEIYGCQLEAGSYKTSYIPNHGTSGGVTRAADSMNATHDADLFTSGEGVVFMEFEIDDVTISGYPQLFRIENPSATGDRFWGYIFNNTDSGKINFGYRLDDNTVRKMEGSLAINTTANVKLAMRLDNNNYAVYYNGTKSIPGLQYAGVIDNLTKIVFSSIPYPLGVSVKQFAVFNEALSDSELATLTTL